MSRSISNSISAVFPTLHEPAHRCLLAKKLRGYQQLPHLGFRLRLSWLSRTLLRLTPLVTTPHLFPPVSAASTFFLSASLSLQKHQIPKCVLPLFGSESLLMTRCHHLSFVQLIHFLRNCHYTALTKESKTGSNAHLWAGQYLLDVFDGLFSILEGVVWSSARAHRSVWGP
jgi:hypothetical protein